MDDHIASKFDGEIKLHLESFGLRGLHRAVGNSRLREFRRARHQRTEDRFGFVTLDQFTAGQMIVIHPGLADRDDFGMARQRGEFLEKIHCALVEDVARVEPDHGMDIAVFLRDSQRPATTRRVDTDRDDAVHTGGAGARDDGVEMSFELGKVEMRVGVGQHDGYQRTTDEAQVKPPPKTTMRMWSPCLIRPVRWASSRAMATAAADVLP